MRRILIVDDNTADRLWLFGNLAEQISKETAFDEAASLDQARQKLQRDIPYDAILLDLNLGDSEGIETYYQIRLYARRTPIIILTGSQEEELAQLLLDQGADHYVVKGSTDPKLLYRIILGVITRSRHSIRLSSGVGSLAREAIYASDELMSQSKDSGQFPAVHAATAIGRSTEMLALVLQRMDDTNEDLREIRNKTDVLTERVAQLRATDVQIQERQSQLDSQVEVVGREVQIVKGVTVEKSWVREHRLQILLAVITAVATIAAAIIGSIYGGAL